MPPRELPRAKRVGKYDWWDAAEKARRHPGDWVLCFEQVSRSWPNAMKRGRIAAFKHTPKWKYEMRTRNTTGDNADLWLRATREES